MSLRVPLFVISATLFGALADGYAADAAQVLYTNKRSQLLPLSNVEQPNMIRKARLFVTTDNGNSWTMQKEIQVAEDATELPKFPFHVESDGAYGVMPCTTYRSGKIEPDPVPGQSPPYILMVDTLAPTITTFEATMIGRSAQKAVVRVTWSVNDLHLDKEPIAIEASTDDSARFTTMHRGGKDGAAELVVPVSPDAREVQLRLVVTDRARNVNVSPSRSFNVGPKPGEEKPAPKIVAPADPQQALAQAVATLPTLAEVGATPTKPLPTKTIAPPSQANPAAPAAPAVPQQTSTLTELPAVPVVQQPAEETPKAASQADIVVNGQPYVPPAAASANNAAKNKSNTDLAVVIASDAVDQAYYKQLAATRNLPPENPRTVSRHAQPAAPIAEEPPAPVDGRRLPPSFIPDKIADPVQVLTDARLFILDGKIDAACDLYERIRYTSLGKTALHEQVHILNAKDRPRDAITAIMSAPVEIVTDEIRLDHARALLLTGRPEEVAAAVSPIRTNVPESRPALLLIIKSYLAMGRISEANRGLDYLARGDDAVAAEARALQGR